jgi:phosphotransferase system enzyme I (PtsI)
MACDRSNGSLTKLLDPLHPAILELIGRTVAHGRRAGTGVSLCGDMAGDQRCIPALLSGGLRELSVNPSALANIKQAIDQLSRTDGGRRD